MTNDTTTQPETETKRRKSYTLHTFLSDDAGAILDRLSAHAGLSRTAWLETTLRAIARGEENIHVTC